MPGTGDFVRESMALGGRVIDGAQTQSDRIGIIKNLLIGLLRRHSATQVQFRYRSTASKIPLKKSSMLTRPVRYT